MTEFKPAGHSAPDTRELLLDIEKSLASLPLKGAGPEGLYEPIAYILEDGGKRLRPMLALLACGVYGSDPRRAMGPAVGVEVFHNFTLLHDDIMDRAPLRRGRETAHRLWGENGAILSGDAMLILAYSVMCGEVPGIAAHDPSKTPALLTVFNRAAMEVCQGQQLDMEFERRDEVSPDEYIEMIRLKTASLIAAAAEMGGICGDASPGQRRALYDFGIALGLAFQIEDDLLDTYGSQQSFGKSIGGDIAVGKKTFLQITALGRASSVSERAELLLTGDASREHYERVRAIYDTLGVRSAASAAIGRYFDEAMQALGRASDDPARLAVLSDYAALLVGREK